MSAVMGLIPEDQMDALLQSEVDAFFKEEQLMGLKQEMVTTPNPGFKPGEGGYYNKRYIETDMLVFKMKMTPFRQTVWNMIHEFIAPKITAVFDDVKSQTRQELDTWIVESVTPQAKEGHKINFNQIAVGMSSHMFANTMRIANEMSVNNLKSAMNTMGVSADVINRVPLWTAP